MMHNLATRVAIDEDITERAASDLVDLDALRSYLQLHVLDVHNLQRVTASRFGAVATTHRGFHLKIDIADDASVTFDEHPDLEQRVLELIARVQDRSAPRLGSSQSLRTACGDPEAGRMTWVSLAQESTDLYTYQWFDFTVGAANQPQLSYHHCISHFLLRQHFYFRARHSTDRARHSHLLTDRQAQIVRLIGLGLSDKQIAIQLGVSPHTVHNVIQRLLRKHAMCKRIQLCRLTQ